MTPNDGPDSSPSNPESPADPLPPPSRPASHERIVALLEVLICSDYPSQLLLSFTLAAFGMTTQDASGGPTLSYIAAVSLLDSVVLIGLIFFFLAAHRDSPRELFLGRRSVGREARAGVLLTLVAFILAVVVLALLQKFAPGLHTVEKNPLQAVIRTKADVVLFALVVVIAGGVREEIQRAFLLNRFERWLGGSRVGLIVTSLSFGAGHLLQGLDAVVATTMLGAFWAVVYLRRRSVVAPVVSHSGFDLLQILQLRIIAP